MDLFEEIQDMLGCEYISDIRIGARLNMARRLVASLNLSLYPTRQLQDMANYLYSVDCIYLSKEELISFLKDDGQKSKNKHFLKYNS